MHCATKHSVIKMPDVGFSMHFSAHLQPLSHSPALGADRDFGEDCNWLISSQFGLLLSTLICDTDKTIPLDEFQALTSR